MDAKLKRVLAKIFEIEDEEISESLSPETVVLWDSLNHLKMVTEIERVFAIKLTMAEIRTMVTFQRIKEVVEGRQKEKSGRFGATL